MLVVAALLVMTGAPALSTEVEVSPAVVAMVRKYGKNPGLELQRGLEGLEKSGDRTAAALLGELLMMPNRLGGPDFARSCDHSEAAGQHPEGLHNLATCYFNGTGRPRDLAKARELYRQAADKGFAKSACAYGNMLIKGEGGATERARGLELCRRAADAGEPDAQTDYGGYLLTNQYVPKDAVAARSYLSLAAAKDQANAAFLLGQIYWNGDGTDKDNTEAAKWWTVAYRGGRLDAAYLLGNATFVRLVDELKGKRAVPQSLLDDSRRWYLIAVEKDSDPEHRRKAAEGLEILNQFARGAN